MNRIILFLALVLTLVTKQNAYSQATTDKKQQFATIGDCPLQNGQHIRDCKIDYRTFANQQDHLINQSLSIKFAKMVNAELVEMDNELGHLIFSDKTPIEATRKFLSE